MKYLVLIITVLVASVGSADEIVSPASTRFADRDTPTVPDFQKHVVPLLGRIGCNSAKCHGSFQGQGDFRLSLFGFDFKADHSALNAEASSEDGNRLNLKNPNTSLILRKPSGQNDHEGGKRFEVNSWEYNLLSRWIEAGARGARTDKQEAEATKPSDGEQLFLEKIQPLLEANCYECHGYSDIKANFRLTSREGLLKGGKSGPAIVPHDPDKSLLVQAIRYRNEDLQMPPSGKLKQQEIADLEKWVRMGAPWPDRKGSAAGETDQVLVGLSYEPNEILFQKTDQTARIRIIAEWQDGQCEDVTCLSRFQTNNNGVVTVNKNGLATSVGEGDTHIVALYDNGVAAIPVLRRYAAGATADSPNGSGDTTGRANGNTHPIDRFINEKLNKLGLVPSSLCTDAEFLRRVSIDMTGTLPTPMEVTDFLADKSNNKRNRKIDELLKRSTYAAWWANKLCDFTGCNPKSIASLLEVAREEGYVKASAWYDWIYERVKRNEPYDKLVDGIMLPRQSGSYDGMPTFWLRESLKEPKDTAMSVAHAFLGIQLQCAECHKHPFDQWTQADFSDFSKFFDSLTAIRNRKSRKAAELRLLRSRTVKLKASDDPRKPIMDWFKDPKNPWFARAFVNRVWAGYFSTGIVDPPDQFTPANPPSNPALLDWLTRGFIDNGYDMKWLHRQITTSDTYQRTWKPNATNRNDRRNYSRSIPRRIPAEVIYDAMKQATAANDKLAEVRTNLRRRASGHLSMRMAGTHAMKVFGKPDRSLNCDCERVNEPTLLQAIFTQNDPLVRMRVADSGWIIEIEDAVADGKKLDEARLVNEVWLRTVGRNPTGPEQHRAKQHLASTASLSEGISDLMWALMNTKEFLLNH